MRLYIYILSASKDPDNIECYVPFKINNSTIFFGPCKRNLRKELCKEFNVIEKGLTIPNEDIYVMGVNGSNDEKIRKIVWLGRIKKLMTFEKAYTYLKDKKMYEKMINHKYSPLHVRPYTEEDNQLLGYRLESDNHIDNDYWVTDIAAKNDDVVIKDRVFTLKAGLTRESLVKDCCFICDNLFFAEGEGIKIDKKIFEFFKLTQIDRDEIDNYAIFGLTEDSKPFGRPGRFLKVNDEMIITDFISYIETKGKKMKKTKLYLSNEGSFSRKCCDSIDESENGNYT